MPHVIAQSRGHAVPVGPAHQHVIGHGPAASGRGAFVAHGVYSPASRISISLPSGMMARALAAALACLTNAAGLNSRAVLDSHTTPGVLVTSVPLRPAPADSASGHQWLR